MIGISWLVSHEVCVHIQYIFGVVRNKLQTKEDQKFKKRICHVNMLYILTNEKHFPQTINQWEFDYGLFTNLPRIIVAFDFPPSSLKSKEVSYLSWQITHSNLKTTRHIKLKFSSELLENLLLAKYLISITARLKYKSINNYCWSQNQNIKR